MNDIRAVRNLLKGALERAEKELRDRGLLLDHAQRVYVVGDQQIGLVLNCPADGMAYTLRVTVTLISSSRLKTP